MGLIMNVNIIKNMKMPSNRRHLCLFILLFSVVFSLCNAYDQSDSRSNGGADHFGPPVIQLEAKYNNRDLSEISVRKPQQTQHHHHLRHQSSHNSAYRSRSNGAHHKQHNHQSNDSAYNRIPGYPRQAHSPKKHTHHVDDDASEPIGRGGFHMKNHTPQQQQHQSHRPLTTMGPNKSRSFSQSNSYGWTSGSAEKTSKKNWSDNLSRNRQAPYENTYSSMNRNRAPNNPYMRSHRMPKHTTTTTTSTTTTTTVAPDLQEKVFFDAQNNFNNIESDEVDSVGSFYDDHNDDDDVNFHTKKRSPPIGPFDRNYKTRQQSSENFQRDDPVRSSNSYNRITTSAFKPQPASSSGDNYQLNVNNDGSTRSNNNHNPTIETSKSVGDDVKITQVIMTRNNQTRLGAMTEEKFRTLGTHEAVNRTFHGHNHRYDPEIAKQINAHVRRVNQYGSCKPKMKVTPIPHNPMKTYSPHCTVLHRCNDDISCCHTDYKTCQPRHIQIVTLPFWVTTKGRTDVELMTFENHTECDCVLKSSHNETSQFPNDDPAPRVEAIERFNFFVSTTTTTEDPIQCHCPNHFNKTSDYHCKCDCPPKQHRQTIDICNRLKTGLEHFSIKERRCISSELCERPTCEYGEYDEKAGHCPRKDEAFSSNALNSD